MTINERIRLLRKSYLNMNQTDFASALGMKQTSVSSFEKIGATVTEPTIKTICSEFHVDYIWLTTGEGDSPFAKSDDDFYEKIDRIMAGENDTLKNLIKKLVDASDEDIAALQKCIDFCATLKKEVSAS